MIGKFFNICVNIRFDKNLGTGRECAHSNYYIDTHLLYKAYYM